MITTLRRSPAHITSQAAAPLPRWALAALVLAFVLPGLFGHDLWPQDAVGFGRMWTMAHGTAVDWLLPNVAGAPALRGGPLPSWAGAALLLLLGPVLGATAAAATANLVLIPLAIAALWSAVQRFALHEQAQPVAGAFGGEAKRGDYARLLADVAVLVLVGTVGIVLRLHQTEPDAASLTIVALALFALTLVDSRPLMGAVVAGACGGALALTLGPLPAGGLLLGSLAVYWRALTHVAPGRGRTLLLAAVLAIAIACALIAAWPLAAFALAPRRAQLYFEAWRTAQGYGMVQSDELAWLLRNGVWFLWPLWPLAGWALYAWRSSGGAPHIERPLLLLAGLIVAWGGASSLDEHDIVCLIPPLAVLAAFGTVTLRRALDNVIDWLAIAIFSLALVFFWGYYIALQSGTPRAMAASINRLAQGYQPHVHTASVLLALLVAAAWVQLIVWRVSRRPRVLWRGPLLAAAGVAAAWITANLLFLPAVDYVLSYRSLAQDLAAQLRSRGLGQSCVQAYRIPLDERALLAYYGRIRFDREDRPETCRFALHRDLRHAALEEDRPPGAHGTWEVAWEAERWVRPEEHWRIWARVQ